MSRRRSETKTTGAGPVTRCAIYTRKSSEEGLQQEFNSLDAQREAAEAYIASQKAEGWSCLPARDDDGGYTGGNMERPALRRLLADIESGTIDCVVVYKVDRLSRSLPDFARMLETFEQHKISFVAVTQHFNSANSMGRLTLNILLSFARFEREIIGERIRDKIAASRQKGKWTGGTPILGYDVDRSNGTPKLVINPVVATRVRQIFKLYLELGSLLPVVEEVERLGWRTKAWTTRSGKRRGDLPRVVLVGDRGMLTQTRITELQQHPGLGWISALRSGAIRALAEAGSVHASLFDPRNLAEIESPEFPGERLVVCFNPLLAEQRRRKREELLAATERELTRITAAPACRQAGWPVGPASR